MTETRLAEEWSGNLLIVGPQILTTKQVTLGFYTLHLYDHLLTLSDEIEFMWNARVSTGSILFFVNRYYSFIFFTISFIMKVTPVMDPAVCKKFALFLPIAGGIALTIFPDIVLALRVYALHGRRRLVGFILATYLLAELGVALWIYLTPGSLPLTMIPYSADYKELYLCMLQKSEKISNWKASLFQFMQIGYDTIVIAFMLRKAKWAQQSFYKLLTRMIQDNTLYYAALLAANLTWALMILLGPNALKYIAASPTLVIACTMISRLTISLRKYDSKDRDISFRTMDIQTSGIQIAFPEGYDEHTDSELGDDFRATKKCVSENSSSFDESLELG